MATTAPKGATSPTSPASSPLAAPAAPAIPAPTTYVIGKPYSPRNNTRDGTAITYAAVIAHLQANGPQTAQQLQAMLQQLRNHASWVNYAIARQWLAPSK